MLFGDSEPYDSSTWLPVSEIVEKLGQGPLKDANKLLILDAGRLQDEWGLGILHNQFATGLQQMERTLRENRVFILNSDSPGEHSHLAPELGGSAFGYFVAHGLRGMADRQSHNRITFAELHDYVLSNVATWVSQNRLGGEQRPMLISADPEGIALADTAGR